MPQFYHITIQGQLDPSWSGWLAGMQVTHLDEDTTLLSGSLADQTALYSLIERLRDLNLTLISVTRQSSDHPQRSNP